MTETEKVLNVLEINENIPVLVIDEESIIISGNDSWLKLFNSIKSGHSFYNCFDKNTSLLIKNSLIDAKTFLKIQKRNIQLNVNDDLRDYKIIISPFKIDDKHFYYVLLTDNSFINELVIYPTIDDSSLFVKYEKIFAKVKESLSKTLDDKENIQFVLDSEKEAIAIKDKEQYLFTNNSFNQNFNVNIGSKNIITADDINASNLFSKIKIAESEVYSIKSHFVIEEIGYSESVIHQNNRILLFPISDQNKTINGVIIFGSIINSKTGFDYEANTENKSEETKLFSEEIDIQNSDEAIIIYDKNNYDILKTNFIASNLYGYEFDKFKEMNITELFPPEEMQKLLMYSDLNGDYIFRQLKSDGSVIEVNVNRENILWQNKEACLERISLNLPDEEVIDLDEINEEENSNINEPDKKIELISEDNAEHELKTDLLSSLFHELLTPVNVILGFVQEIIDSVDEPTEEQKESAQIIKDNQQILLQTMNTAVQFTKLDENKIKLNIEEFDINKYLVDLQDSFSREADKENISVVFEKIPDSLLLKHDRSKLLAAISFLVKFVIKLTNSSKIFISFQVLEKQLFLIVKDNDNEISETVSSDILEIFNKPFLIKKKNYGISPITIRLANKLNELLSVKVIEYSNSENFKTIALVTPVNIENSISASVTETSLEEIETTETKLEEVKEEITEEEILTESLSEIEEEIETLETPLEEVKEEFLEDGIVTNTSPTVEDEIVSEPTEDIANGEVDNKIIEDIEEEEEIITEEIATIEKNGHDNLNLSNLSCLFIDDSVDSQLLFKSQMNDFKLLKVSHNFSEALPLLNKYKFDLIIVDIHLNDTYNGLDVLKIVRQFENYKTIPIIAVTAYPFEGDREKFITFGFSNYFVKPLLREQILNSLEQILT